MNVFKIQQYFKGEEMEKHKSDFKVIAVILLFIFAVVAIFAYDASKKKYEPLADKAANQLISSMTFMGELPYSAHEYKLKAILFCDGINYFVEDNQQFGLMALNCGYMMAREVELVSNFNVFNNEVTISFRKIPIE